MSKRSSLRDTGSTSAWRKIRQSVINRDGCCQMCGTEERLSVDHIIPRKLGGDDNLSNLQVLCVSCNSSKGGTFSDSVRTPMTPLGLFSPKNESNSHYRLGSDENQS
jgi:5-methylcytosine-specific restriction endonuclease McrA